MVTSTPIRRVTSVRKVKARPSGASASAGGCAASGAEAGFSALGAACLRSAGAFSDFAGLAGFSALGALAGCAAFSCAAGFSGLASAAGFSALALGARLRAGFCSGSLTASSRPTEDSTSSPPSASSRTVRRTTTGLPPKMPRNPLLPSSRMSILTSAKETPSFSRPWVTASSMVLALDSTDLISTFPPLRSQPGFRPSSQTSCSSPGPAPTQTHCRPPSRGRRSRCSWSRPTAKRAGRNTS